LEEGTITGKRSFIRSFENQVITKGEGVLLEYALPLPPSIVSLKDDGESVLPVIKDGGEAGI
jgi:hypothetical protein